MYLKREGHLTSSKTIRRPGGCIYSAVFRRVLKERYKDWSKRFRGSPSSQDIKKQRNQEAHQKIER